MNRRKSKKIYKAGTLITVQGTHCVFMVIGLKGKCELESFNGINIVTGKPVVRCDGLARIATKKEQRMYWASIKTLIQPKVEKES